MEARFSRLMGYDLRPTPEDIYQREVAVHVPADAITSLDAQSALSRFRIEQIAGHDITRLNEVGDDVELDFEGNDPFPEDMSEIGKQAELALLFERIADSLRAGHEVTFGREPYSRDYFSDLIRILVTHGDRSIGKPQFIYSRLLIPAQLENLFGVIYPPKLNSAGFDIREELREGLLGHIDGCDRVILQPAQRLN